ncbi:MAG: acetylornithine transaminase [Spirochaetes bacterium]|nr:acetylornithine transaminase [Spirochaetota bacterium]
MMNDEALVQAKKHILSVSVKPDTVMTRGKGDWLWDTNGRRYLDFIAGWAVNALGHSPRVLKRALARQAGRLVNASPTFYNDVQAEFAELLAKHSGFDRVFFCSTGAEANESAVKLARKYGALHRNGAYGIVTLTGSFHGRTLATMSASGKAAFKPLFEPKVSGFTHVPINDIAALDAAVDDSVCAVMLEPVQGEGGVYPADAAYLEAARRITRERNVLLIFDEVQTGLGRTGRLFAFQRHGIIPDILTLGKGIGGGFPLAAMLCPEALNIFTPGEQGGTYTGQPLAMAAGLAVVGEIIKRDLSGRAETMGALIQKRLHGLAARFPICNIRGEGLLIAFDMPGIDTAKLRDACFADGLIINAPQPNTIRFMPALTVAEKSILHMFRILERVLERTIHTSS